MEILVCLLCFGLGISIGMHIGKSKTTFIPIQPINQDPADYWKPHDYDPYED